MSTTTSPARPTADREVLITRVYDAPRNLVFRAWTDRDHLERWFAPVGCTIRFVLSSPCVCPVTGPSTSATLVQWTIPKLPA